MNIQEFVHIAYKNPRGIQHNIIAAAGLPQRTPMNARLAHDRVMLRDMAHLLQSPQDLDRRIGAIIGADKNMIETERFVMRHPFEDIGRLVLHRRDDGIGFCAHVRLFARAVWRLCFTYILM